jgi:trehalose monomycolate/heme transporter
MLDRWGRFVHRRRALVLGVAILGVLVAALWGTRVFGALKPAGFEDPNSDSHRASQLAEREFGRADADVVVLFRDDERTVDDPTYESAVTGLVAGLPRDRVLSSQTYWSTHSPRFVNADRTATFAVLQLAGADDRAREDSYQAIRDRLSAPGLTTQVGGRVATASAISERISSDIGRAESLSMPALLVLLVVVFGSLAAASLPLAVGAVAILGSFTALRALTYLTDVSVFSINVITILGLGLAVDYGLFMVSRFREEIRRGKGVEDALARTMATAGRTVAVSGVTVAISLASLLLFPQMFLRSMGFGGVATVLVDMLAALTVLPALLSLLGQRVDALSVRRLVRHGDRRGGRGGRVADGAGRAPVRERPAGAGFWYRVAHSVMRRPVAYAVTVVVALLALGLPFRDIAWGGVDQRVLPAGAEPRQVSETLAREFPGNATSPIEAVVTFPGAVSGTDLSAYVDRLGAVPGVTGAEVTGVHGRAARVDLAYRGEPNSARARDLVAAVRDVAPPPGATVLVGGASAVVADQLSGMADTLPWMALVVGLTTFVLLFLAFGSVLLPLKAIVMNVLSLSATFGALVWVFQYGHLSGLLDFTPTGFIEPSMPVLVLAIVFGLSMDYEVFLLSRVREQYDRTGDNAGAVAVGLQCTGGIITSAALLLLVVVGAFSASGITFIKLVGVGMIVAVLIDATVVRALLVPATMRLLGRANWWAPAPLRRLHARYGVRGEGDSEAVDTAGTDRRPAVGARA